MLPGVSNTDGEIPLSIRCVVATLAATLALTACAVGEDSAGVSADARTVDAPTMTIYRSPDCSCCHAWADIARGNGWTVASADKLDMNAFKTEVGVPVEYASCHTAVVDGYFVEGHVPLAAVERLLADRPDIDGIALPGMPPGSPGMGGTAEGPFEVLAITDGVATPFGSY